MFTFRPVNDKMKKIIITTDEVPMYHVIINPASRSGRGLKIWKEQIEPALLNAQISYHHYLSKNAGDVMKIAENLSASMDGHGFLRIIVLGGDGTVNEVLQGISDPSHLILGYIPTGSSNDLARDLKIPKDPLDALQLILHTGKQMPMDLGYITYSDGKKRRFLVSCGFGYDAAICEETNRSRLKNLLNRLGLGKLTYVGIALKQLFAAGKTSCRLILDHDTSVTIDKMLFTCCMLHRYEGGGFMFAPDADAHDGMLNLCTVGDIPKLLILTALPTALYGKHYMFRGITPYRANNIVLESDKDLWVHTDGEVTRKERRITVSCNKDGFYMLL